MLTINYTGEDSKYIHYNCAVELSIGETFDNTIKVPMGTPVLPPKPNYPSTTDHRPIFDWSGTGEETSMEGATHLLIQWGSGNPNVPYPLSDLVSIKINGAEQIGTATPSSINPIEKLRAPHTWVKIPDSTTTLQIGAGCCTWSSISSWKDAGGTLEKGDGVYIEIRTNGWTP